MTSRVSINKKNADGLTPVHIAAMNHCIKKLKKFKKLKANFKVRTNDGETPLLLACKNMPISKVHTLAEKKMFDVLVYKGCDINVPDKNGYSPLHYAARLCSGRVIVKLIRFGADVHCQTNKLNFTPLHCAMQCSRLDVVDALIRHGAKVNAVAMDRLTPLHLAVASSSVQIAKYLIDLGAKLNYRENVYFFSPMHIALLKRRRHMLHLLESSGADVNIASRDGVTCLHLATMMGDIEIVEMLIDNGADVNCREKNELITPVHIALSKGKALNINLDENSLLFNFLRSLCPSKNCNHSAIFFLLLENGADVKTTTRDGRNAFHLAIESGTVETTVTEILFEFEVDVNATEYKTRLTPLLIASREGLANVVEKLVKFGADVNAVTKAGKCSLHFAIESRGNWLAIVKLLLSYGANSNCKEENSWFTPLHTAARRKGRRDVIKELIIAGAEINALTSDGRNTLHLAIESSDAENVKILVEHGVDVKHKETIFQYTALHFAAIENNVDVIEVLVNGGVDVNAKDASGKTALHLATCFDDKVIEKLMFCGAYVDLRDNQNKTPLHYAMEHDNVKGLMFLIDSGANINDILICQQFCLQSVLAKSNTRKTIINHLLKLIAIRFPVADTYKHYITQNDFQSNYYKKCVMEVRKLKKHTISVKVSLYDFLHMDPENRFTYAKNIVSFDLKSKFEIYSSIVQNSYREAVDSKPLIEPAKLAMYWLVKRNLPDECTKKILSYLKSWHLKAIVATVENERKFDELLKPRSCCVQ